MKRWKVQLITEISDIKLIDAETEHAAKKRAEGNFPGYKIGKITLEKDILTEGEMQAWLRKHENDPTKVGRRSTNEGGTELYALDPEIIKLYEAGKQ